jgi:hypothetical protein
MVLAMTSLHTILFHLESHLNCSIKYQQKQNFHQNHDFSFVFYFEKKRRNLTLLADIGTQKEYCSLII